MLRPAGRPTRSRWASLAFATALALPSCASDRFENGEFRSRSDGFSIQLPAGWQPRGVARGSARTFRFTNLERPGLAITVTIMDLPADVSLDELYSSFHARIIVPDRAVEPGMTQEEFVRRYDEMLRDAARALTMGGKEPEAGEATIDGAPARWFVFSHLPPGQATRLTGMAHVVLHGSRGFIVGCEALEDAFAAFRSSCEQTARAMRFLS